MPGNKRIPVEDRQRLIDAYEDGEDFVALAHYLKINRSSAYSIIRLYQSENRVEAMAHAGGRPQSIDGDTLELITMLIEAYPQWTTKQLREEVCSIFSNKPSFSVSTLNRALEGECYTVKMARDCPAARNSESVKIERKLYSEWMVAEGIAKHRIYIDECGFNLWTRRTYGRALVGERVNRIVGGQRGRNATIIAAISDQVGLLYHEIHFTSVNKEVFSSFIYQMEVILEDEPAVLIMDNAPVHNGISTDCPNLEIKFLPRYSPFLNPIENSFSVLKSTIKRHLQRDENECSTRAAHEQGTSVARLRESILQRVIETAVPSLTQEIVSREYAHANRYLTRCLQMENIFN